jgi:hypothetical protein
MKAKQRRNLKGLFADPQWERMGRAWYGFKSHAGGKTVRELKNEEKARKGQPLV